MNKKTNNESVNKRDVRFFKQNHSWYADVPNHTLAENLMVAGADALIESVSNGNPEVMVSVAWPNYPGKDWLFRLSRTSHNQHGATYDVTPSTDIADSNLPGCFPPIAWICNVTHDVLGEHPESIYILSVKTAA